MEKKETKPLAYWIYDTPAGDITVLANSKAVVGILYGAVDPEDGVNDENIHQYDAIIELNQYFYGQRKTFDLSIAYPDSAEACRVYDAVKAIPYGETRTYEEVAKAARTKVDKLIGILEANPIPVIIPCHRVVKDDEDVGTYVWDVELKKRLLKLEKANAERLK